MFFLLNLHNTLQIPPIFHNKNHSSITAGCGVGGRSRRLLQHQELAPAPAAGGGPGLRPERAGGGAGRNEGTGQRQRKPTWLTS